MTRKERPVKRCSIGMTIECIRVMTDDGVLTVGACSECGMIDPDLCPLHTKEFCHERSLKVSTRLRLRGDKVR